MVLADTLSLIAWFVAVPMLVLLAWLIIELLAGLIPGERSRPGSEVSSDTIAFLIPAHNEAAVIAATIRDLKQKTSENRILVVADNCQDETAHQARMAGADVAVRMDPDRRGKGYALAFGRDVLAETPPSIVVVLDADCTVSHTFTPAICAAVAQHSHPAQASNLFVPDRTLTTPVQISNFAMLVKNLFRMRGLARLGNTVALLGTGMAFPWSDFAKLKLATGDATEDIKLTLDMIAQGSRIAFVPEAQVWSRAESAKDTVTQRQRWEHGFLGHSLRHGLPNLFRGLRRLSRSQIALALHMLVPPIALLYLVVGVAIAITGCAAILGGSVLPVSILATAALVLTLLIGVAYVSDGRPYLSPKTIATAPLYIAWKLPIYLGLFTRRQSSWQDQQ